MSGRRNLVPGDMPTWSTAGLMATGLPSPLDRNLTPLRPELRPRTYEANDARNTGGSLGLGSALGPIALDYARPSPDAPAAAAPAEGCTDCG